MLHIIHPRRRTVNRQLNGSSKLPSVAFVTTPSSIRVLGRISTVVLELILNRWRCVLSIHQHEIRRILVRGACGSVSRAATPTIVRDATSVVAVIRRTIVVGIGTLGAVLLVGVCYSTRRSVSVRGSGSVELTIVGLGIIRSRIEVAGVGRTRQVEPCKDEQQWYSV